MMTSYFFASSIRIPPIFTNSASTPSTPIALIFSTSAGGNVFSIPNKIPIFFTTISLTCHPEVLHEVKHLRSRRISTFNRSPWLPLRPFISPQSAPDCQTHDRLQRRIHCQKSSKRNDTHFVFCDIGSCTDEEFP